MPQRNAESRIIVWNAASDRGTSRRMHPLANCLLNWKISWPPHHTSSTISLSPGPSFSTDNVNLHFLKRTCFPTTLISASLFREFLQSRQCAKSLWIFSREASYFHFNFKWPFKAAFFARLFELKTSTYRQWKGEKVEKFLNVSQILQKHH